MRATDLTQAKDPFILLTFEALKRAAQLAREDAIKTNTGIIVSKNGKIVAITAAELKQEALISKENAK